MQNQRKNTLHRSQARLSCVSTMVGDPLPSIYLKAGWLRSKDHASCSVGHEIESQLLEKILYCLDSFKRNECLPKRSKIQLCSKYENTEKILRMIRYPLSITMYITQSWSIILKKYYRIDVYFYVQNSVKKKKRRSNFGQTLLIGYIPLPPLSFSPYLEPQLAGYRYYYYFHPILFFLSSFPASKLLLVSCCC